ncbi:MAG: hypothetical protein GY851_25045 [bacterium]|nr:hypothetical protein [bacterium]
MSQSGEPTSVLARWQRWQSPELPKLFFRTNDSLFIVVVLCIIVGGEVPWARAAIFLDVAALACCLALVIGGRRVNTVALALFWCLFFIALCTFQERATVELIAGVVVSVAAYCIAWHRVELGLKQRREEGKNLDPH